VKCSDRVFDYIAGHGGIPVMWKSGHSLIKEKVKTDNAPFGGELAGHVFFADDALYAGLRVIEVLGSNESSVAELLRDLPEAFNPPEIRIDTTEDKKHEIVDKLKRVLYTRFAWI
jgi:phosphomannomutase/phosphomannomutase/phosphoglucomutase